VEVLSACSLANLRLIEPHYESLSEMGIARCQSIIANLIKSDVIRFPTLWRHARKAPFKNVKKVVREGIAQLWRKSRSFENLRVSS
jgi:hypothetical protein